MHLPTLTQACVLLTLTVVGLLVAFGIITLRAWHKALEKAVGDGTMAMVALGLLGITMREAVEKVTDDLLAPVRAMVAQGSGDDLDDLVALVKARQRTLNDEAQRSTRDLLKGADDES